MAKYIIIKTTGETSFPPSAGDIYKAGGEANTSIIAEYATLAEAEADIVAHRDYSPDAEYHGGRWQGVEYSLLRCENEEDPEVVRHITADDCKLYGIFRATCEVAGKGEEYYAGIAFANDTEIGSPVEIFKTKAEGLAALLGGKYYSSWSRYDYRLAEAEEYGLCDIDEDTGCNGDVVEIAPLYGQGAD